MAVASSEVIRAAVEREAAAGAVEGTAAVDVAAAVETAGGHWSRSAIAAACWVAAARVLETAVVAWVAVADGAMEAAMEAVAKVGAAEAAMEAVVRVVGALAEAVAWVGEDSVAGSGLGTA